MHNKKKALIVTLVLSISLLSGCNKAPTPEQKIEKSNEIMKQEQIEPTEKDQEIIKEVAENKDVEYSYVTHHEETVMLKIKFRKGLKDEERHKITAEYMDKVQTEYPDKNINVGIVPNEED